MENILEKIAQQVPALVVLVYLVIVFTKSMKDTVTKFLSFVQEKEKRVKEMADRMNSVIERNTEVLAHVKVVLSQKKDKDK